MRNIVTRISRLERSSRPADVVCFIAYGVTERDAKTALSSALLAGTIRDDDPVVWGVWPHDEKPPAPRWVKAEGMSTLELDALLDRFGVLTGKGSAQPGEARPNLSAWTDTELLAAALARPASEALAGEWHDPQH